MSKGQEMESMCKTLPFGGGPLKELPIGIRLRIAWVQLRASFQQYVIQHTCIHHGSKPSNRAPTHKGHRVNVELEAIFQEYPRIPNNYTFSFILVLDQPPSKSPGRPIPLSQLLLVP